MVLFTGIALIITGISNSKTSVSLSPITRSNDAIIKVKYPPSVDAKTLPVTAHIIPIIEMAILYLV